MTKIFLILALALTGFSGSVFADSSISDTTCNDTEAIARGLRNQYMDLVQIYESNRPSGNPTVLNTKLTPFNNRQPILKSAQLNLSPEQQLIAIQSWFAKETEKRKTQIEDFMRVIGVCRGS